MARKKRMKKVKENVKLCGLCEVFQTIATKKRTQTTIGTRTIFTRFCSKLEADVQADTDACKDFKVANIIHCKSDNKRVHTEVCIYRYEHKIDDCGKCLVGGLLKEMVKGGKK